MINGKWELETVGGHPCDVYTPTVVNERGGVLLYLHGVHLDRLHDKHVFVEQFEQRQLPVVAPLTQRSWWTNRVCPEFDRELTAEQHLLENVLPFVESKFGAKPPQIGLWGIGMGGQGALRIAYKHPRTFPLVAAISPAVDFHNLVRAGDETLGQMFEDPEAARQETAILFIHPLNWPPHQFFCCDPSDLDWWEGADRLRMKLDSLGVRYESDLETVAGGHGFDYYNSQAERTIGFLAEHL
jgi:S-formylglutathione hydrolase FrmB